MSNKADSQDSVTPKALNNQAVSLLAELTKLAVKFGIPSITTWQQGYFIDSPDYALMGEDWKKEQRSRENTLIRPGGGMNNALFQVTGAENDAKIAAYLQLLGELLTKVTGLASPDLADSTDVSNPPPNPSPEKTI